ncbi:hypothetical protein B0H16DRAFT_1476208 [Mycena metata]|uniref:Uncharacterized protein n=1 Tax=Mycena metata TaxID=1033252 RepID=A0AAD7HC62_9AGAR|nr:hypothetical protein B0H16DRAFT_1476208 [Mycena metata]
MRGNKCSSTPSIIQITSCTAASHFARFSAAHRSPSTNPAWPQKYRLAMMCVPPGSLQSRVCNQVCNARVVNLCRLRAGTTMVTDPGGNFLGPMDLHDSNVGSLSKALFGLQADECFHEGFEVHPQVNAAEDLERVVEPDWCALRERQGLEPPTRGVGVRSCSGGFRSGSVGGSVCSGSVSGGVRQLILECFATHYSQVQGKESKVKLKNGKNHLASTITN